MQLTDWAKKKLGGGIQETKLPAVPKQTATEAEDVQKTVRETASVSETATLPDAQTLWQIEEYELRRAVRNLNLD